MTVTLVPKDAPAPTVNDGPMSHLVPEPAAVVTAAYVNGTPLMALCGHRWVPHRNPATLPTCATCVEINEQDT
jgi:hypothetical protein